MCFHDEPETCFWLQIFGYKQLVFEGHENTPRASYGNFLCIHIKITEFIAVKLKLLYNKNLCCCCYS